MRLPQPVPEPEGAEERLALPNVPLPPGVEIVLGSEVVAATRDRRRRGTLVNVWATWCGSCEPEMPMLAAIQRRYAARGIELMVVSVDDPAQAETVLRVQHDRGIPGMVRIAHPELGDFKRALSPIWKGALPATFLFDSKGQLRYFWGAQAFEREIVPVLDGLLAGEPIDGLANFQVQGGPRP